MTCRAESEQTNWDIDFNYAKTEADGEETQNNALLYSDWDWKMPSPRWSWFTKLGLEYDEFKQFNLRLNLNTGFGYLLVDAPKTQFRGRFGGGTSREFGGPDDDYEPEATLGADFAHEFSKRQKMSVVVDYFPTWDDFSDYRVVTDASWKIALDEEGQLNLKIGVIDRYDSTPNGVQPNDVNYSLVLLWHL